MRKVLIHICCAPCFTFIQDDIEKNGILNNDGVREKIDYTAIWYNPNIHPKVEYERRKNTFIEFCKNKGVDFKVIDEYDLNGYISYVVNNVGENKKYPTRCEYCYYMRFKEAFIYAKENGYDAVTTTLTISPYQNHDIIKSVLERLSKEFGVDYIYTDYRENFRKGQKMARELGLYMQKYCGCVFSFDQGKWVY